MGIGSRSRGRRVGALALCALACAGGAAAPERAPAPRPAAGPEGPATGPDDPAAPESPFPSAKRLEELAEEEAPGGSVFAVEQADVDAWTLRGPLPERIGEEPLASPGPFDEVLLAVTRSRPGLVVASEAMRCAARELAHFVLEKDAAPPRPLRRFILGRCGATGTGSNVGWFGARVPTSATEAEVVDAWRPGLDEAIERHLGSGPRAVGIAFARRGEEALALVVSARRRVHLEPVSSVPDAEGWLRLRGELLDPAGYVGAGVNRGAIGFAECEADPAVRLPRFSLACAVDRNDVSAWIAVSSRRPERLLAESALGVLARPSGGVADRWERGRYGGGGTVDHPDRFAERLLAEVNRLRRRAGAPPLALEAGESALATKLAPFYFGSSMGLLEGSYGDLVALGLMAGWRVDGLVRGAHMAGTLSLSTLDLGQWLAEAFQDPGLREVLMDPESSRLAVGPLVSEQHRYLAAVLTSYRLVGDEDPGEQREAFYARLNRDFDQRGLRFPRRARDIEAVAERHAARVRAGSAGRDEAIEAILDEASALAGANVKGWVLDGTSVEDAALPDALFSAPPARIAVAVTLYQPAAWPWARLAIFVVTIEETPTRTTQFRGRSISRAFGDTPLGPPPTS